MIFVVNANLANRFRRVDKPSRISGEIFKARHLLAMEVCNANVRSRRLG